MKKVLAFILSLVVLFSIGSLTACSPDKADEIADLKNRIDKIENSTVEYEAVEFTVGNAHQYVAINVVVTECVADYIETNIIGNRIYNLSCVVTVTTTRATDCHFEGKTILPARITYDIDTIMASATGWDTTHSIANVDLGYNGESSFSFSIWKKKATGLEFPSFPFSTIFISAATGTVLVPKEA